VQQAAAQLQGLWELKAELDMLSVEVTGKPLSQMIIEEQR